MQLSKTVWQNNSSLRENRAPLLSMRELFCSPWMLTAWDLRELWDLCSSSLTNPIPRAENSPLQKKKVTFLGNDGASPLLSRSPRCYLLADRAQTRNLASVGLGFLLGKGLYKGCLSQSAWEVKLGTVCAGLQGTAWQTAPAPVLRRSKIQQDDRCNY